MVVLSGRAELGPRASGNWSILAPATEPRMSARLNLMREKRAYGLKVDGATGTVPLTTSDSIEERG